MSRLPAEPWRELPPRMVAALRPELPELREAILAAIADEVPEYARPFEGTFGRNIRLGVDEALGRFADLVEDPGRGRAESREVYVALGRGEMREGRSLDALQAAYRVGARVAWRRLSAAARAAGFEADVLSSLADAIFAYIDELAADSVDGYAQAQQAAAGARERTRRELLALMLTGDAGEEELRAAAAAADWPLPVTLAAIACAPEDFDRIGRRAGSDALAGVVDELGCIALPDASGPGRRALVASACEGARAALGPDRSPRHARESWERARTALAAMQAGVIPAGFCVTDDQLVALALFEAREPLRDLAAARLAPLDELTPRGRARMLETLAAFLAQRGNAAAMAEVLHVHPQTARYRIRRLRDLFGDALDDANARFELEAAVRVASLTPAPGAPGRSAAHQPPGGS